MFLPVTLSDAHPHFNETQKPETLLFHLADDIGCTKNIASEHPDVIARLTEIAEAARKDLGDKGRRGSGQRERGQIDREPQPQRLQKLKQGSR
jgi:arylsulfatase A